MTFMNKSTVKNEIEANGGLEAFELFVYVNKLK